MMPTSFADGGLQLIIHSVGPMAMAMAAVVD